MSPLFRTRLHKMSAVALATGLLLLSSGCIRDPNVRKQMYLESGKRYENQQKMREAIIQFSNALKIDHNYAEAHYELGKAYLQVGSINAAYSELLTAVDLRPDNIAIRLELGNLQMAGGLVDDAAEQAKAVLAREPNNPEALALRSTVESERGNREAAFKDLRTALSIKPNLAALHIAMGVLIAGDMTQLADAIKELQTAITLDDKSAAARSILAAFYERLGKYPEAIEQAQIAVKLAPKEMHGRTNLAGLFLRSGNRTEAEFTLRQATEDFQDDPAGASMLSDYYVQTDQLLQAESAYGYLTVKYPKSPELRYTYARILLMLHEDEKATKLIQQLTKENADNPEVEILNATLLAESGKINEAFDLIQKAITAAPENIDLQIAMGKAALSKRDIATAVKSFNEARRLNPDNEDAAAGIAEVADLSKDSGMLRQVADKMISHNPEYAQAYVWRAISEGNQGYLGPAEKDFQTALSKAPAFPAAMIGLAQIRASQNRIPEATTLLENALQTDPRATNALDLLIAFDLAAKQPKKALDRINALLTRVPHDGPLYKVLTDLDIKIGDLDGARTAAAQALQIDPSDEEAIQYQANIEVAAGRPDQAVAIWQGWIANHPNDADALTLAGEVCENKGDVRQAVTYYRKAVRVAPGHGMASNNLAGLLADTGTHLDEALAMAKAARSTYPSFSATADTLGWVYYQRGNYSLAHDQFEDAIKADPKNPDAEYHMGLNYEKQGNKPLAAAHLKKAIAVAAGTPSPIGKKAAESLASLR